MNYSAIKYCDIANGRGVRTTLFVSGCRNHCEGCFNPETWSFEYGDPFTDVVECEVVDSLRPVYVTGLTVLGGEPLEPENQPAVLQLLARVKHELPEKDVWLYTGFTYERLMERSCRANTSMLLRILSKVDVLVDGPFVQAKKDIALRFRGSSNQRLIDWHATWKDGSVKLWEDDPVYSTHEIGTL